MNSYPIKAISCAHESHRRLVIKGHKYGPKIVRALTKRRTQRLSIYIRRNKVLMVGTVSVKPPTAWLVVEQAYDGASKAFRHAGMGFMVCDFKPANHRRMNETLIVLIECHLSALVKHQSGTTV